MKGKYITLDMLPERTKGICYKINSGRGLEEKLNSRGIFKGVEIEKIRGNRGSIVVKVKNTQFAVGYGIARKIIVIYR